MLNLLKFEQIWCRGDYTSINESSPASQCLTLGTFGWGLLRLKPHENNAHLENPFEVAVGETLDVQVLFEGALLKDVLVEFGGEAIDDGNGDGVFSIPWAQEGLKTIEASYSVPLVNDPDTDEISYSTSLGVQPIPEPSSVLGVLALGGLFVRSALQRQKNNRKKQLLG